MEDRRRDPADVCGHMARTAGSAGTSSSHYGRCHQQARRGRPSTQHVRAWPPRARSSTGTTWLRRRLPVLTMMQPGNHFDDNQAGVSGREQHVLPARPGGGPRGQPFAETSSTAMATIRTAPTIPSRTPVRTRPGQYLQCHHARLASTTRRRGRPKPTTTATIRSCGRSGDALPGDGPVFGPRRYGVECH